MEPSAGVRELASFVSRVPSNHGHVVWHPEPSSQDIPPWVRHSTQVSVPALGNPVQSELSKQLVPGCPRGVGRGRGVGVGRGGTVAVAVAVAVAVTVAVAVAVAVDVAVAVGVNVAVAVAVAVGVNVGVAVGVPHGPPPLLRVWTSDRN